MVLIPLPSALSAKRYCIFSSVKRKYDELLKAEALLLVKCWKRTLTLLILVELSRFHRITEWLELKGP